MTALRRSGDWMGRRTHLGDGDYFPTPTWGTLALLECEAFRRGTAVLEPACGAGHIARALESRGLRVAASDLYNRGYGTTGVDFLATFYQSHSNLITNPPFDLAEEFVAKGLAVATDRLCLLMRLAFIEGGGRYERVWRDDPPTRVWAFSERIRIVKNRVEARGSSMTPYAWYVWDRRPGAERQKTVLRIIPPGFKARWKHLDD